jgi:hypothetical protein
VILNTDIFGKGRCNEYCRAGFIKYICWTIHITILMRITSANNPATPIDMGSGLRDLRAKIDPKPPNPLADVFRTSDTVRIITNLRKGALAGEVYNRIEFSWAHIVPCSLPSPQAMGRSEPPYLHARETFPDLQYKPTDNKGATKLRTAKPPKLSRSIEPA